MSAKDISAEHAQEKRLRRPAAFTLLTSGQRCCLMPLFRKGDAQARTRSIQATNTSFQKFTHG